MEYKPPLSITDHMIQLVSEINEFTDHINTTSHLSSNPKLRRDNRIRTIQASLAIENNSLSLEQVTAILNGKRILGAPQEIREVKNAYEAYEVLLDMNPYSIESLLNAHKILMLDLVKEAGRFRSGGVGIFAGDRVVHVAPPVDRVP